MGPGARYVQGDPGDGSELTARESPCDDEHVTVLRYALVLQAACSPPASGTPVDARAPDADIDATPSPFGRCGGGTDHARLAYGRLASASPEGALIASPALGLWPVGGGAVIPLPGVDESAVLSGGYLYWRVGDIVIERSLAGAQREVTIGLPVAIVRSPDGGVYVVTAQTPATIARVMPGAEAQVVTTAPAITDLGVSADVLVWQEGAAIRRRVLSSGLEGTVLTDGSAHLLGVRGTSVVVERHPAGASSVEIESYDVASGVSTGTLIWSDGPVLATTLGANEIYVSLDRRETMVERQWCSLQPSLVALVFPGGTSAPLVTEPERVIAAPGQIYVQTAADHGQTCCSGHGMFSCNQQSMDPQSVWCFVR